MRILLVKTSSLGDVIHNLPVVADIHRHVPAARIDWCVEESFADIPCLHPGVSDVITVAIRRWRKQLTRPLIWREIGEVRRRLRAAGYDRVIDTQGLLKSAIVARWAGVPVAGYDRDSIREPLAALAYRQQFSVATDLHAVERNRLLVGAALGYAPVGAPDYGLQPASADFDWLPKGKPYVLLLSATSRDDKLWPEAHWVALGQALAARGVLPLLPGGSAVERERAARLAAQIPGALALPVLNISALAAILAGASACVGVDTGLTHLAVALAVPTVALYTATDPGLTGVLGSAYYLNLGGAGEVPAVTEVLAALRPVLG